MTTKKRTVGDADLEPSLLTAKKRKINDKDQSASLQTIPSSTESPSTSVATNLSPDSNAAVNNININHCTKTEPQNDNTAKSNANTDPSKWSFEAGFTFGDNSWVRQSSNVSTISTNETQTTTEPNAAQTTDGNTDTFSQYTGLGFQSVLENENSKDGTKQETESGKQHTESKENEQKTSDSNPWGGVWSNSNPDGTFKLTFDWGNHQWDNGNTKIDLNPTSSIGWGSTAPKYDPDDIEKDDRTQQVMNQMTGEQDAGDTDDEVKYSVHCKVYNLEGGTYVERGKGMVKLNTYTAGKEKKLKGRILCRRDQTLTTLINAGILKKMKFERTSDFIRFGVVEVTEQNEKTEKEEGGDGNVKEEEGDNAVNKKEEDDEDDDMMFQTYLIRPLDKSKLDILLNKIKEIQELIE